MWSPWAKSILVCSLRSVLTTHKFLLFCFMYLSMYALFHLTVWTDLPLPPYTHAGIQSRLSTCAGCKGGFSKKKPGVHICTFRLTGFSLGPTEQSRWMQPCGVAYHGECVKSGPPFHTRLEKNKGLSMPPWVHRPHFVCELCTVRMELQREIQRTDRDIHLLMFERMRMIDAMNWWQHRTLQHYGPHLKYLFQ
jgi:hypothetical protein